MISLDGRKVKLDRWTDGTVKVGTDVVKGSAIATWKMNSMPFLNKAGYAITWAYDSEDELFALYAIVNAIREITPSASIELLLPYLPHARQDRENENLFTLKYFCKFINSMNFNEVTVVDPHSEIAVALLDRCWDKRHIISMKKGDQDDSKDLLDEVNDYFSYDQYSIAFLGIKDAIKYKYLVDQERNGLPIIYHGMDEMHEQVPPFMNYPLVSPKKVLIVSDIFSENDRRIERVVMELKKRGVQKIALAVSHCENNIMDSYVLQNVNRIFTSDSILTYKNDKINILYSFRECRNDEEDKED